MDFWTADATLQNVSCHNKSRFRQLGRSLRSPNKHLLQVLRFFCDKKTLFIPSVESTRRNHVVGALLCTWKLSADGKHAPHREGLQSTVTTHDAAPLHSAGWQRLKAFLEQEMSTVAPNKALILLSPMRGAKVLLNSSAVLAWEVCCLLVSSFGIVPLHSRQLRCEDSNQDRHSKPWGGVKF